jgi:PASTA domain
MSVTTSPPAFADPLAEEGVPSSPSLRQRHQGAVTSERAALLAPDVEGCLGAEAIELVRARGLIAAIETVEITGSAAPGVVIRQDPPAGSRMVREGVLTLQVAQAPAEAQGSGENPAAQGWAASGIAVSEGGEDDTEEWFATLRPTLDGPAPGTGALAPRRRRKHRRAPVPVDRMVFDTPPDPLLAACEPLLEGHLALQPVRHARFGSAVAALLVRLPALSVSPNWRRRVLVVAGAIVGLVVLTRGGGSHSHHQVPASLIQASASPLRAASTPALPRPRPMRGIPTAGLLPRPSTSRRSAVRTRRPRAARIAQPVVATASDVGAIPTTSASSSGPPAPAPGPFVYLGK